LRRRVDAWEIEQGLRPARLPDALTLARRIAAFEAAQERFDDETIAASGRYVAAAQRKQGLDIETWLPGRLVATFTPTQRYWMDRMRSTPGT
jgi:hypothetical protein